MVDFMWKEETPINNSQNNNDQPKEIIKQRVVRSNHRSCVTTSPLACALNDGWRVLMCHKLCDGCLEYILEKKVIN